MRLIAVALTEFCHEAYVLRKVGENTLNNRDMDDEASDDLKHEKPIFDWEMIGINRN